MIWRRIKQALLGPARGWRWPVLLTIAFYLVSFAVVWILTGAPLRGPRIALDLLVDILLACLIFSVSRRVWPFCVVLLLYFATAYVGSAVKVLVLGRPIMPEEVHNLSAVIMVLGPLGWIAIALPLALLVGCLLINLSLARWSGRVALASSVMFGLLVSASPAPTMHTLDRVAGNWSWDQKLNFYRRGGTLHLLLESVRLLADHRPTPNAEEVASAIDRLRATAAAPTVPANGRRRNVHVLLLESFWDPSPLIAAHFNITPMDPRFTALWAETGHTQALSPSFGGYTANVEFEVLCGFPVDHLAAKFESGIDRAAPCLPALLRAAGYRTIASHPNTASFWNRTIVYDHLGFETFWSVADMQGDWNINRQMPDKELFRQVSGKIAATRDDRPVFDYQVTIDAHWDYKQQPDRADVVESDSTFSHVTRYANALYYKSRDVMDVIEALRRDDPDALIVAFGDHLPHLGRGIAGYYESGLLPESFGEFSAADYDFSARTPLIVIDGINGPLNLGTLPMYRLPGIIARLLGETGSTIFDLAVPPARVVPRPLPNVTIAYTGEAPPELCLSVDAPSPLCDAAQVWLRDVKVLERDLFEGHQHVLDLLGLDPKTGATLAKAP
jgi:phosphoglycerol transferase MdoB-like AlkP superfamily enzyme